jgi:hypothetical protein
MKRNLVLAMCATIALVSSVQAIEMKAPNMSVMKNVTSAVSNAAASLTPSSVKGTVSEINTKLIAADTSVQTAFNSLVAALSSKEDAAKCKAKLNAINNNKNLSASEKSAKIAEIMTDYGTTLKENQEALGEQIKTASAAKRTEITNAVIALAVASFQYVDIANDCKNIAMSISTNPTLAVSCATELASLKDTASILKNNIKSLKNVTTQAVAVAKIGGLEIKLPKPGASKAKKANI